MIQTIQVKIIHVAVAKLALSDEEYHDILNGHFNKKSCKELNYFEASELIDYFKKLGFKIPKRKNFTPGTKSRQDLRNVPKNARPENVVFMPSSDQLDMIDVLAGKITWQLEDGFHKWIKKYLKIDRIKTDTEASNAIEGLKGLLANQKRKARREERLADGNK